MHRASLDTIFTLPFLRYFREAARKLFPKCKERHDTAVQSTHAHTIKGIPGFHVNTEMPLLSKTRIFFTVPFPTELFVQHTFFDMSWCLARSSAQAVCCVTDCIRKSLHEHRRSDAQHSFLDEVTTQFPLQGHDTILLTTS